MCDVGLKQISISGLSCVRYVQSFLDYYIGFTHLDNYYVRLPMVNFNMETSIFIIRNSRRKSDHKRGSETIAQRHITETGAVEHLAEDGSVRIAG